MKSAYSAMLAVTIASLLNGCSQRGDTDSAATGTPPPPSSVSTPISDPRVSYPKPNYTAEQMDGIRWMCENRAREGFYQLNEQQAWEKAKRCDTHYMYVGLLAMYPTNSHRAEIEKRMETFRVTVSVKDTYYSMSSLEKEFNWNGDDALGGWGNQRMYFDYQEAPERGVRGPVACGNIQFDGAITFSTNGIRILAGTKIIFPIVQSSVSQ